MDETQQSQITINSLLESFQFILNQSDFQSAAHSVFDLCKRAIGATAGYIALLIDDGSENEMLYLDTGGELCAVDPSLSMPIRGLCQEVYCTNKTLYENDFSNTSWIDFVPQGRTNLYNVLLTPMMIEGSTVGLLGLANKPAGFNQEDAQIAAVYGKLAAIALLNSRSIEKLHNSELRFRSIAQSASDAIITIDKFGKIIFWNKAATTIFGYLEGEALGEQLSLIMPDRLHKQHREGFERLVSGGDPHLLGKAVEMVGVTKGGDEIPVELSLASWKVNEDVFFSGIIRDISERNRAQREIQSLAKFPQENRNPVLRVSQDGKIVFANQASLQLIASWGKQDDEEVPDQIKELVFESFISGETRTTEIPCGEQIYSFDLVPVQETQYVNLYGRDISEQVRDRTQLKEQNQFIMSIFESIRHPFYVVEASDYTIKMANPATHPNAMQQRFKCYALTHHIDKPCFELGYDCPLEQVKKHKVSVTTEHIHYDEQGNLRIDEVHAHPIFDDQGNVIQVIEYLLDITERKQVEEALERERDFISAVLDTAGALVVVLDLHGRIIRFNHACEQLTGYRRDEVVGQRFWDLFLLPEEIESVKSVFSDLQSGVFPNKHENTWVTKEGDHRLITWSNTTLLDPAGSIKFIIGTGIDITKQRQIQEALQTARDELEERVEERTAELKWTNQALELEATKRHRAYQSELRARKIAETLSEASLALTQSLNVDKILNTLLEFLSRLIPFDSANIAIMEDESTFAVRAARGYETWATTEQILKLEYRVEYNTKMYNMLNSKKSVIISNTRQRPDWNVYPGTEHVQNWMGIPIVSNEKVIGLCGLEKTIPNFFTLEHLQISEAIISQASVAIQNAWLFEQVRAGRERLQSLSRNLVEIQEEERRYVARELHDEAGQALTSVKVGLQLLERDANNPEAIHIGVNELQKMIDEVSENLHRLAVNLRPATLDHLGLVAALRQYIQEVSKKNGLAAQFEVINWDQPLADNVEAAIYRIVQEALTNVARHAQATRVDVILEQLGDRTVIIVEDNGIGFDSNEGMDQNRIGISGMRERTEMLGGELTVESSTGVGTTLFVEVPFVNSHIDSR